MFGFKLRQGEHTEETNAQNTGGDIPQKGVGDIPQKGVEENTTTISEAHNVLKYTKEELVKQVHKRAIPPFLSQDPDDPKDDRTIIHPKILE